MSYKGSQIILKSEFFFGAQIVGLKDFGLDFGGSSVSSLFVTVCNLNK